MPCIDSGLLDATRDRVKIPSLFLILSGVFALFLCSGCVVKRTVTDGGSVVAQGYIVKKPWASE